MLHSSSQCFAALARGAQTLFIGRHLTSISILSLESFKQDLAAHQILVNQCALQHVTFPSFSLIFFLHTANSMLDNKFVKKMNLSDDLTNRFYAEMKRLPEYYILPPPNLVFVFKTLV